jgi:hypothetical protein
MNLLERLKEWREVKKEDQAAIDRAQQEQQRADDEPERTLSETFGDAAWRIPSGWLTQSKPGRELFIAEHMDNTPAAPSRSRHSTRRGSHLSAHDPCCSEGRGPAKLDPPAPNATLARSSSPPKARRTWRSYRLRSSSFHDHQRLNAGCPERCATSVRHTLAGGLADRPVEIERRRVFTVRAAQHRPLIARRGAAFSSGLAAPPLLQRESEPDLVPPPKLGSVLLVVGLRVGCRRESVLVGWFRDFRGWRSKGRLLEA